MPKKPKYKPTSDGILSGLANPLAELFERMVSAEAETRGVSQSQVVEEILDREGPLIMGKRWYENAKKVEHNRDALRRSHAIKKGWYDPANG